MKPRQTAPNIGDILWAYLPEEGHAEQAKKRPVLVVDVEESNGLNYVTVAKGTSQQLDAHYLGELRLAREDEWKDAGLSKPTKFQLKRLERLPMTDTWFDPNSRSSLQQTLYIAFRTAAREAALI